MGTVVSLHIHPPAGGAPMLPVESFDLEAEKGIVGNTRYFGRISRSGKPGKRQVTLIEREQIEDHAAALQAPLTPGAVRSNIETRGIDLAALIGREVQVGGAVLFFCEARTPCEKMDRLLPGLRSRMENSRQGVIARVITSGTVRLGDEIKPVGDCSNASTIAEHASFPLPND